MNENKLLKLEIRHLKETIKLQAKFDEQERKHIIETAKLTREMSELAINKAEVALVERMESSNNKFALLKDQAGEFATIKDIKALEIQLSILSKIVYIGMGGLIVLQFLIQTGIIK